MKKNNAKKLRVLWHSRKVCAYITFCSILGFFLGLLIVIKISKIVGADVWRWCITLGALSFFAFLICIYLFIFLISNGKTAYIYYEEKIIIKGKRKLYYTHFNTSRTTCLQKMFNLITIEFRNESEKIILKDVSKKLLDYL